MARSFKLSNVKQYIGVILISGLGILLNYSIIPYYTGKFGIKVYGQISLDYSYFLFFLLASTLSIHVYIFSIKSFDDFKERICILRSFQLFIILVTTTVIKWLNVLNGNFVDSATLGILLSALYYNSGISWADNKHIIQRLLIFIPILYFHISTLLNLNEIIDLDRQILIIQLIIIVLFTFSLRRIAINKINTVIGSFLAFSIPILITLISTNFVDLRLRTLMESIYGDAKWGRISVILMVLALPNLGINAIGPILQSEIGKLKIRDLLKIYKYALMLVYLGVIIFFIISFLIIKEFFFENIPWQLILYCFSLISFTFINIEMARLKDSKPILVFGLFQIIIYFSFVKTIDPLELFIFSHFISTSLIIIYEWTILFRKAKNH